MNMTHSRYVVSSIAVLALIVLVGQGCPGAQQDTTVESDTQMETDAMLEEDHEEDARMKEGQEAADEKEETSLKAGSETFLGLTLPAGVADRSDHDLEGDNQGTITVLTMSEGTVKDVHNYFLNEVRASDWEIYTDAFVGFDNSGTIGAMSGEEEITVRTSIAPITEELVVQISHLVPAE